MGTIGIQLEGNNFSSYPCPYLVGSKDDTAEEKLAAECEAFSMLTSLKLTLPILQAAIPPKKLP